MCDQTLFIWSRDHIRISHVPVFFCFVFEQQQFINKPNKAFSRRERLGQNRYTHQALYLGHCRDKKKAKTESENSTKTPIS